VPAEASIYSQWAGDMQYSNRDGQLVGVVANFGHAATRFDSKEKFLLPKILSQYVDVHGFKPPLVTQNYAEFEFEPRPDGRRVWLRCEREGVLAIGVWRSWPPWYFPGNFLFLVLIFLGIFFPGIFSLARMSG
jgi:hypothetical protein